VRPGRVSIRRGAIEWRERGRLLVPVACTGRERGRLPVPFTCTGRERGRLLVPVTCTGSMYRVDVPVTRDTLLQMGTRGPAWLMHAACGRVENWLSWRQRIARRGSRVRGSPWYPARNGSRTRESTWYKYLVLVPGTGRERPGRCCRALPSTWRLASTWYLYQVLPGFRVRVGFRPGGAAPAAPLCDRGSSCVRAAGRR
jgi:hypothetical protein